MLSEWLVARAGFTDGHRTPSESLVRQVPPRRNRCQREKSASALRAGGTRGENTLIPALRQHAARFGVLFGLHTTLQLPELHRHTQAQLTPSRQKPLEARRRRAEAGQNSQAE